MSQLILVTGLYRSGSTWLFNCLREAFATETGLTALYANSLTSEIIDRLAQHAHVVVKSHHPALDLLQACGRSGGDIFLTIRDPRDCVASQLTQFKMRFQDACAVVTASCATALAMAALPRVLLLRYETRFMDNMQLLDAVNRRYALNLSQARRESIFASLRREAVAAGIESHFSAYETGQWREQPLYFHDPARRWHPFHVGDGRERKYLEVLSTSEAEQVVSANRDFMKRFYPASAEEPPSP